MVPYQAATNELSVSACLPTAPRCRVGVEEDVQDFCQHCPATWP